MNCLKCHAPLAIQWTCCGMCGYKNPQRKEKMTLHKKLEAKITELEQRQKKAMDGPFYDDPSYYRAQGREEVLEDIISELKELLK